MHRSLDRLPKTRRADFPIKRIAEFTPGAWAARKLTDGIRRWNHRAVGKTDTVGSLKPTLKGYFYTNLVGTPNRRMTTGTTETARL